MKLDLFDIDAFVQANNCPQITSPIMFDYTGQPHPEGLFSYDLFGYTDEERKNIFGYIDLKNNYIHPLIYLMMEKKMGSLGKILHGEKYAVIADKKIKYVNEDFKGAETGIDFIYDHFYEINWFDELDEEEIDSLDKKTRLKFLKNIKREEMFVRKWLVIPPFYRDASSADRSMGDAINDLYKKLISYTRSMSLGFSFDIFGSETRLAIQNLLKDLYLSTMSPISGKHLLITNGKAELKGSGKTSMIRKHLLGKTVDWGASAVITSPHNSLAKTPGEKPVPFGYSGFPLASLLALFQPFYLNFCGQFLETYLNEFMYMNANKIKKIDVGQYSGDIIEKMIKRFIEDKDSRFDPVGFEFTDLNGKKQTGYISIYEFDTETDAQQDKNYRRRLLCAVDLFYIASKAVAEDKHVYVTRFPIANYQNIFPARVKILSTTKTRKIYYKFYLGQEHTYKYDPEYPMIPSENQKSKKVDLDLYDVMICGNQYLASLGGDYDGDMLYMRAVFTQEANVEADELIYDKKNFLDAKGELTRGISAISKENILGLFELTKDGI